MGLDKKEYFYITTPIYYINDEPHIGHFYCTVAADTLARYHRLIGDDVYFVTGTDENSQKTVEAAKQRNMDIKEYTDMMAENWKSTWKKLNISFDFFVRTTTKEHIESVKKLFMKCYENGDIYKKEYEGWYCVGCEKFLTETEMENGLCPVHKTKPQWVKEENYFFKLSKYEKQLLELLKRKDFALPEARRNEMLEFIKQGLQDISISRATVKWGIPVPIDDTQVIYVWFDALINYITALGYHKDDEKMKKYWPVAIHLVGKDIFRFHTIMWPAMLISAGLTPPKQVFGHGFFTINGEKISKSLKNVINPLEISRKYTTDCLRYYMLREIPFGKDSDFSTKRLEERYRGDLANDLGNLVSRSINMILKFSNGKVPSFSNKYINNELHLELKESAEKLYQEIDVHYSKFEFSTILEKIWRFIRQVNKYIDTTKPWELNKAEKKEELNIVLYNLAQSLRVIALFIYPVLPETAEKIYKQLGFDTKIEKENYLQAIKWENFPEGQKVSKGEILFPKLEEKKEMQEVKKEDIIDIEYFKKIKLKVARIISAEKVEGSEKLLKLKVKTDEKEKTLVAGIAKYYNPEELKGRLIIIIDNLKPAKLKGIVSEGMLLAAQDVDGKISLLMPDKEVKEGSRVF